MKHTILLLAAAVAAIAEVPKEAFGQLTATSRQTMFGTRTLGGFPTAGTRTFSGSSLSRSSLGTSTLSGFGSSSFGRSSPGLGGSALGGSMGSFQLSGSERFIRGARQPGQFVGADTQEVSGILSTLGTGARIMSNQNFNVRALSGQGRSRVNQPGGQPGRAGTQSGRASRSLEQLAVAVELGFEPPQTTTPAVLSQTLTTKIGQSKRIQALEPIQVLLAEDGTAVLRGVVATQHDRELVEQWVLLEPGVRSVRNELQVGQRSIGLPAPAASPNQ